MIELNTQPAEKIDHSDGDSLDIAESPFLTIQGEGPFAGRPAVFVRLAGCTLICNSCDTDYTSNRSRINVGDIIKECCRLTGSHLSHPLVVLTGGEPFRQNISVLTRGLTYKAFDVQVETNGTIFLEDFPFQSPCVSVVCSPKTPTISYWLARHIKYVKYILRDGHVNPVDGLPSDCMAGSGPAARVPWDLYCLEEIYVQPLDEGVPEKNALNLKAALDSCLHYGYRLSIQQHKILGVP